MLRWDMVDRTIKEFFEEKTFKLKQRLEARAVCSYFRDWKRLGFWRGKIQDWKKEYEIVR